MRSVSTRLLMPAIVGLASMAMVAAGSAGALARAGESGGDELAQQVDSGAAVYDSVCSYCHGAAGEGGEGPALIGPRAIRSFRTAGRLYTYVRLSMPNDNPGSLSDQEYYDVIAFLLDANELNPEGAMVDADSVDDITLQ